MTTDQSTDTPLDDEALRRVAALKAARDVGKATNLFSATAPDIYDMFRLARFILTGDEDLPSGAALEPQMLEATSPDTYITVNVTSPDAVANAIVDAVKIDVQRVMENRGHNTHPAGTLALVLQAIEDARPVQPQPLTVEDAQRAATEAINAGRSAQVRRSLREMGSGRVSELDAAEVPEFLRRIEPSGEYSTDTEARPPCGEGCCR